MNARHALSLRTATLRLASLPLALLAMLLTSSAALGQSGIQVSPDAKRVLVSKDVGGQRWAITRNPDGTVTGNVFSPSGGPPQFVWCQQAASGGGEVRLSCSGADACPLATCETDEWLFIAEVTLPESFFAAAAPTAAAAASAPIEVPSPMRRFTLDRTAGGAVASSGLQVTPDLSRTLISKDVGDQRWAITRNEDGTATGNVFFPGGGDPQFVWCEQTGASGADVLLRCLGAPPCPRDGSPCAGAGWTLIADGVPLPASFFVPREDVPIETLQAALVAAFGNDDAASAALVLAVDRGYSLRQVARAALSGRLRASGEVVERSGAIEPPDDAPAGFFAGSAAATPLLARPSAGPVTLDQFLERVREKGKDEGVAVTSLLLGLLAAGYPPDQIVEELFFFDGKLSVRFILGPESFVVVLIGPDGNPVKPRKDPPGVVAPPAASCGNGVVDGVDECDGTDFGGKACSSFGSAGPGQLRCIGCRIYTWDCNCGNGTRDAGEECDGSQLQGRTCQSYGLGAGSLSCDAACIIDTSACGAACAAGGGACCDLGEKRCNGICIPDDAPCCGDGIREGSEPCDRADLGGATCGSQGQGSGTLRCDGACELDTSGCTGGGTCPGGTFACEGGCAPDGADCCAGSGGYCAPGTVCVGDDSCCPASAPKRCGNACAPANEQCCEGLSCCGNGNVEGTEVCDGADLAGETCTSQGKPPGALRCSGTCNAFDYTDCGCDSGFKLCGGQCIPSADVCCDGGTSCPAGTACSPGGGCCGNGAKEGAEACDGTVGCGAGQVCGTDCSSCVSTTSCAGRCCAGRNDNCTPPGVGCYCDDYCVEAGDCCGDFAASCG